MNTWPDVPPKEKHTYCFDLGTGEVLWDQPEPEDVIWPLETRGDTVLRIVYPQDTNKYDDGPMTVYAWKR